MLYTSAQLLQIYNSPQSGWIAFRNDEPTDPSADVSGVVPAPTAVKSDGVWKIHVSIAPEDMTKAIPILLELFCDPSMPRMGMKVASKGLLEEDHQSGKEVALIFDRATETSKAGQRKILTFLDELATEFEIAGIKPESKPPLTIETEAQVSSNGSEADKKNLKRGKYDATIKFRENEALSYFNYRDELFELLDDDFYDEVYRDAHPEYRSQLVKRSEFDKWSVANNPQYKHNPLKRNDDFLYGVVLEKQLYLTNAQATNNPTPQTINEHAAPIIPATNKKDFLEQLEAKLKDQSFSRVDILDLFAEMKKQQGAYSYIHQQRNLRWDNIRLFFKSRVLGQGEDNFWHTATYQKAVKLLKIAYVERKDDQSDNARHAEAMALVDYVRGNSPIHFKKTSTRKSLK